MGNAVFFLCSDSDALSRPQVFVVSVSGVKLARMEERFIWSILRGVTARPISLVPCSQPHADSPAKVSTPADNMLPHELESPDVAFVLPSFFLRLSLHSPVALLDHRLTLSPLTQTLRPVLVPAPVHSLGTAGGRVSLRAAEAGGNTTGGWNDADKRRTTVLLQFVGLFNKILQFLGSFKEGEDVLSFRQVYGESVQGPCASWWSEIYSPKSSRGIPTVRQDSRHSALRRSIRGWFGHVCELV